MRRPHRVSDDRLLRLLGRDLQHADGDGRKGLSRQLRGRRPHGLSAPREERLDGRRLHCKRTRPYLFENTAAYEKWLRDILDAQLDDGNLPGIVPSSGWGYHWGNGPAWDSALPVAAWNLWTYRGDRRILDEIYPALVKYLAYTATKADASGLVRHGLGDWVPVDRTHMPSTEFTSSCYYYQAQRIAAEIATLKGLGDEAAKLNARAAKTRAGINGKFYKGDGVYDNGHQSAQAFPLAYGIVEASEQTKVAAKLIAAVERTDGHIDVGLLGSKHLFRALSRIGRTDLAFRIVTNPTKPSPTEWVQKGGTTARRCRTRSRFRRTPRRRSFCRVKSQGG